MSAALRAAGFAAIAAGCVWLNAAGAPHISTLRPHAPEGHPLLEALGESKATLGDLFYLKSDSYFHGGLDRNIDFHEEEGQDAHGHAHEEEGGVRLPEDWIGRLNRAIRVVEDRHLEGAQAKEILPLLSAASKLDPGNPDVVLASAYWVQRETGRVQDAVRLIEEGLRHRPDSWEMQMELGRIYFEKLGRPEWAVQPFRRAIQAMEGRDVPAFSRVRALYGLGLALERTGQTAEALSVYERVVQVYTNKRDTALHHEVDQAIARLKSA